MLDAIEVTRNVESRCRDAELSFKTAEPPIQLGEEGER
jgi:hypothetical protein